MINIKNIKALAFVSLSFLAFACSQEDDVKIVSNEVIFKSEIPYSLDFNNQNQNDLSWKTGFTDNDAFSITSWTGEGDNLTMQSLNAKCVISSSIGKVTPSMSWEDGLKYSFLAIYPYNESSDEEILKAVKQTVPTDVLVAKINNVIRRDSPVELSFKHIMSRLDINITYTGFDDDFVKIDKVNVVAKESAIVNYLSGDIIADETSSADMSLDVKNDKVSSIMVPQEAIEKIYFVINGQKKFYIGDPIRLESGKYTTLRLNIKKNDGSISIQPVGNVSIKDWEKGDDYTMIKK